MDNPTSKSIPSSRISSEAPSNSSERTLLLKKESFAYRIPPQDAVIKFLMETEAVGWKASDWDLERPDWTGKMRLVCLGKEAKIRLEESGSGKVFAECLVEAYPGMALQPVTDSSRYFVMKVKEGGKTVHLGLGFAERADSRDLNTALHQHFGGILVEEECIYPEKLDLAPQQGETITASKTFPIKLRKPDLV